MPCRLSQAASVSAGSAPTMSRIMCHAARLSAPSGAGPIASETEHCGQKQMRWADDFCRGLTPTVCANRYTPTDFCRASSSRLQRRQYKLSKSPVPNYCQDLFTLLSPTRRRWHKYVEGFPQVRSHYPQRRTKLCSSQKRMAACTLSAMGVDSSAKSLRRSRLSKRRQQVAAVCYRIGTGGIEFLLVQTRSGRWIFPKGGVEPGLTRAQSAALEAFEEAGVHGRIEEIPFARYFRCAPDQAASRSTQPEVDIDIAVAAHLCEVERLEKPQESNRRPTWFPAEKARQRLLKDRTPEFGAELARVIDRAVSRIDRLRSAADRRRKDSLQKDSLQVVYFDLLENRRPLAELRAVALQAHLRKAHYLDARRNLCPPVLRLGSGKNSHAETTHNVTAIDTGRGAGPSKRNVSSTRRPSGKLQVAKL